MVIGIVRARELAPLLSSPPPKPHISTQHIAPTITLIRALAMPLLWLLTLALTRTPARQLIKLSETLNLCDTHFVRCIKTNKQKASCPLSAPVPCLP